MTNIHNPSDIPMTAPQTSYKSNAWSGDPVVTIISDKFGDQLASVKDASFTFLMRMCFRLTGGPSKSYLDVITCDAKPLMKMFKSRNKAYAHFEYLESCGLILNIPGSKIADRLYYINPSFYSKLTYSQKEEYKAMHEFNRLFNPIVIL